MTEAVLAFDEGPQAGMGHKRRMYALSRALDHFGVVSKLVPTESLKAADDADIVVIDSYRRRADQLRRRGALVLAAVDDLGRDLATDLLIDPSPGAIAETHHAARHVLAGAPYALLDPALSSLPARLVVDAVDGVLVATGAGDADGTGARIAAEVAKALPNTRVQLAIGPWGSASVPATVEALRTSTGLGPALAEADLVVTAAGVTFLEALALARPTIAIVLTDNQRQAAEAATAAGAGVLATTTTAAHEATALARDHVRRQRLSRAARLLVDGRGACRVAKAAAALV